MRTRLGTSAAALATAIVLVGAAVAAPVAASPTRDVSTAMRYGPTAPIGSILTALDDGDDESTVIPLPFSINFFGEQYGFVCITENGSIYPRKTDADVYCGDYDEPLGALALYGDAPIISPFAADHSTYWAGDVQPTSDFGPFPAVYAGTTTIGGKQAFVVTWYRIQECCPSADGTQQTWTHQVVLIDEGKVDAGQAGNDFTVEFNYGAIESDEEGYEPDYYEMPGEGYRYGVGWASYRAFEVASVSDDVVTLTAAHGLDTNANFHFALDADDDPRLIQIVDATRLRFVSTDADMPTAGDAFVVSEAFEFFPDPPTTLLTDSDGDGAPLATALTANRTSNAPMNGRYIFGMRGGQTVGFQTPGMGETPAPPEPTSSPVTPSWVPRDGQTPTLPTGAGEWRQPDGTVTSLTPSTPSAGQLRYSGDGITVTFTGAAGTSPSTGLIADVNGVVECEICAFLAEGGVIEAWMFSEPRLVAAWRVEDLPCQRFTIPVASPLDGRGPLPVGTHTLQLVLPTASGVAAVDVGVTVGGRQVPTGVRAGEGGSTPIRVLWAQGALGLLLASSVMLRRRVEA